MPTSKAIVNALSQSRDHQPAALVLGTYGRESMQIAAALRKMGSAVIWLDAPNASRMRERDARQFRQVADPLVLSDTTAIAT